LQLTILVFYFQGWAISKIFVDELEKCEGLNCNDSPTAAETKGIMLADLLHVIKDKNWMAIYSKNRAFSRESVPLIKGHAHVFGE
jgi:hypothetical protein